MRPMCFRAVPLVLLVCLAAFSASCRTAGGGSGAAVSAKPAQADPEASLAGKLFILKDARDMRLAIVRLSAAPKEEQELMKLARNLTMGDFETYLERNAQAKRLTYLGGGRFRMDALKLLLDDAAINEASFSLQLKAFEAGDKDVDGIILTRVVLDGKDLTPGGSLVLYMQLLEMKKGN